MLKKVKSLKKKDSGSSEAIPYLSCTKKPSPGCNNGYYEVGVPLKYIIEACKVPAAHFVFRFVGLKEGWR